MIALVVALLIGIGLASYLMLVRSQHVSTVRAQSWNAALAMAEAGIEEGLAQLNPSILVGTNVNRAGNGWSAVNGVYVSPRRTMTDGYYDVMITAEPLPYIYATGYVRVPTFSEPIMRVVRVKTRLGGLFMNAMAARVNVDFRGFGVETDSFDSEDPTASTGGMYDPAKRRANGDVASMEGLLNVGNAKVMGSIRNGAEADYAVNANGSVGDLGWVQSGTKGIQPGHYVNDFNMDFPEVPPPYSTGLAPESKIVGTPGTNYYWVLGSGNYMVNNQVRMKTGDQVLVTGRARLYVTGDFLMQGSSQLIIAPGGTLELYVAGSSTVITSVNNAGSCADFRYYGLPSNIALALTGNDAFLGTIYAPNAFFSLGGGGGDPIDYQGACVVNTIKMNGHFKFHFDENLRRKGPVSGYQVVNWVEL